MEEISLCANDTVPSAAEAFDLYADTVYRLAFARTGNRSDSDDILQEVFLRYMRSQNKVLSGEHAKALIIKMTLNCSKSLLSSAWFKRTEALDDSMKAPSKDGSDTLDAVMRLPMKYRTVIHLYYYCGYPVNEIAKLLKSNPSTIKSRLSRARDKLKNYLKEVEFDVQ